MATDDFGREALNPWTVVAGRPGIIGGKDLGVASGPLSYLSIDWATMFDADQYSEIVVADAWRPDLLLQLHLRRQVGASKARYGFHYNAETIPPRWEIKYDGVPTAETRVLASSSSVPGPAGGDILRFEARGRVLGGYLNGQLVLSATDNAPNAILTTGGTGITARPRSGTTPMLPAPAAASWRGGSL